MKLVFASDDFGYCEGFNLGLKKVFREGIVTHVNLMTDCPGNIDAFKTLKDHPEVSIGWHQHFRGTPQVPASEVSSLLDETGHFKYKDVWNKDTFNPEAQEKKYDGVKYEEVLRELRAEIELCIKYSGRVPDFGGGRGDNPVAEATNQVCKEYGIIDQRTAGEKYGSKMVHIHQPGEETYLKRINPDSYIRCCTYDPMEYLRNDPQGILKNECSQIAWHAGYFDDYMVKDATYFYDGDMRNFEPSPMIDCAMMCSTDLRDWAKENDVEFVSMTDAVFGTRHYQNYLHSIGSDLYVAR